MCSKIPKNKKLTNQLKNIRKIKHLYLQNRIEIQGTSMTSVNNPENSIRISATERPRKATNHKIETTEMEELNSTPTKDIRRNNC